MAQCRWCKSDGISVTLDARGVCRSCAPELALRIDQAQRKLNRSVRLAGQTSRLGKQLQRWMVVADYAKTLQPFEGTDLLGTATPPSQYLQLYNQSRDRILHAELGGRVDDLMRRATAAESVREAVALGSEAGHLVAEARRVVDDSVFLRELSLKIRNFVNEVQVQAFLDKGRRAEMEGNTRRAVDQYKGALYFLLNDEIDDRVQREQIGAVREKLASLAVALQE